MDTSEIGNMEVGGTFIFRAVLSSQTNWGDFPYTPYPTHTRGIFFGGKDNVFLAYHVWVVGEN